MAVKSKVVAVVCSTSQPCISSTKTWLGPKTPQDSLSTLVTRLATMIIDIRLPHEAPLQDVQLPDALADIGNNEKALVEFQGAIEVEGSKAGELVGYLNMDDPVSIPSSPAQARQNARDRVIRFMESQDALTSRLELH